MTIRYQCVECESVLKIRDDKAGQTAHCPKCKTEFVIPEPAGDEDVPAAGVADDAPVDEEDDALAFLMEAGDLPAASSDATAVPDAPDPPGSPPPSEKPSPSERKLHRPKPRAQVDTDDTASAAGALLAQTESAKTSSPAEDPSPPTPRIDIEDVKEVARTRLLPIGGGFLLVFGLCYLMWGFMAPSDNLPPLGEVSGTVTLDNKPLAMATVMFEPVVDDTDADQRRYGASVGRTNEEGVYTLTYAGTATGAVLGKHTVRVNKNDANGLEVLPKKYHIQSQMKHDVTDSSNTIDLKLQSEAKPATVNPLADPPTP